MPRQPDQCAAAAAALLSPYGQDVEVPLQCKKLVSISSIGIARTELSGTYVKAARTSCKSCELRVGLFGRVIFGCIQA